MKLLETGKGCSRCLPPSHDAGQLLFNTNHVRGSPFISAQLELFLGNLMMNRMVGSG